MSYKSLLFCPDERTARVVTQVLNELEFTVEPVQDAYSAVKKLNDEHFDALVVDCQNEQDGLLLFKTARDSSHNHSSLSVAVVEGQAGVAKAFRIGANLVLTKPINIEQSKGTLRVARGLLRKTEPKPAIAPRPAPATGLQKVPSFDLAPAAVPTPAGIVKPILAPRASTADAPFSALESEPEPVAEPEADEVAVLESLPQLDGNRAAEPQATIARTNAEPIAAASSSGHAAAVAPALDKSEPIALKPTVMPPLVTNEPIVPERRFGEPEPPVEAPAFSSLDTTRQSGGAKFLKIAAILVAIAVLGCFGWQKLRPLQYLQQIRAARAANTSTPAAAADFHPAAPPQTKPAPAAPKIEEPMLDQPETEIAAPPARHTPDAESDSIKLQELPMSRDTKPSAASKPEPLVVKPDTGIKTNPKAVQPTPPPVQVSSASPSAATITNLTSTTPTIPTFASASLRVSQGVSQGLLLKKVPPAYPPMALQLHKEGSVELLATISKQGVISNVKVLSGDPMLSKSAADAVRQWKYRPYLLNGEPVEIQTQITISFKTPH